MRRIAPAVLVIAYLQGAAGGEPGPRAHRTGAPPDAHVSPAARSGPDTPGSPWLDLAPSRVLIPDRSDQRPGPLARLGERLTRPQVASALVLGGLYGTFVTWAYFAWWRQPSRPFKWGGDGSWKLWEEDSWFGRTQYAGGADKLGHTWATLALGRAGTELLHQWGGHSRFTSALVGAGLSQALFFGVEIKDGYYYQFSYGDFAFNTLGAALAFAQSMWPAVDELVDFKVQYVPSPRYREKLLEDGDLDVAEDYSGQTYLLAIHLGGIRALREARWGGWARYVDVTFGFEARGYKPDPPYAIDPSDPARQDYPKRQSTFIGVALDAQAVFDRLLRRHRGWRKVARGALEVFALPYTNLPVLSRDVRTAAVVPDEQ